MPNTITLSGWKEGIEKLKAMPEILFDEIDQECGVAAEEWEGLAIQSASNLTDMGGLVGGISFKQVSRMNWDVVSKQDYSPYLEWGTRLKVSVPGDLQAYASQFRGKTNQTDARKFIYAWCDRRGIPKEFWGLIFILIMVRGINPHPFFFIHKPTVESNLITHVDNILKTEH